MKRKAILTAALGSLLGFLLGLVSFYSPSVFACEVEAMVNLPQESVDLVCSRLCQDFGGWSRQPRPDETKTGPQFLKCECRKPRGFGPCPK